jgi:hypothetical protein
VIGRVVLRGAHAEDSFSGSPERQVSALECAAPGAPLLRALFSLAAFRPPRPGGAATPG